MNTCVLNGAVKVAKTFVEELQDNIGKMLNTPTRIELQYNYVNITLGEELYIKVFPNAETFINEPFCRTELNINMISFERFKILLEETFNTTIYEGLYEK